jgi:hypothetical protein
MQQPPEFSPGDEYDPANCLVSNGWRGLLLEADEGLAKAASAVAEGATVLRMEVTPDAGATCSVDHGGNDEQNMEEKTIKTR